MARRTREQRWLARALLALASTQELVHSPADAASLEELAYLLDDGAGRPDDEEVPR